MYKLIQKNQKKFLAVFAVGLMVVFILPSTLPNQANPGSEVLFHLGDDEVIRTEGRAASEEWKTLAREVPQFILPRLLGSVGWLQEEIEKDPELYLLLQKEATRLGLRPNATQADELTRMIAQFSSTMGGRTPDMAALRKSIDSLLLVQALFDRVADGIKPSEALVMRELARNGQRVKLDMVHYATDDFIKEVPAPTAEQLQKHFDEHRNKLAGSPTDQDPFGFGYLVPARVKLAYLTVPRDEVETLVRKEKPEFDRRLEAMLHYRKNLSQYPVTQPADTQPADTQPAETQPASQPATAPAEATGRPTTRPFEEVQEQIIEELMEPAIDRKVDELAAAVAARLRADYDAGQRKSAGAPKDFGTIAYLERVKADFEKKHSVEIGVAEINEPKDETGLGELVGIGQSFAVREPFAKYIMDWAKPFVPATRKEHSDVLSLGEPSRRFRDVEGNGYVFVLREATAAEPPVNLDAVKEKVESDVRTTLAFEAATAAAKKLEAAARTEGLESAAKAAGKDVFTTPEFLTRPDSRSGFDMPPTVVLPHVDLPEAARGKLVREAFELLEKATPDKPHPTAVVPLPVAGRVVVAGLAEVERMWTDEQEELARQQAGMQIAAEHAQRVLSEYFSPAAVKQRLDYRSPAGADKPTETAAAD